MIKLSYQNVILVVKKKRFSRYNKQLEKRTPAVDSQIRK